MRVTGKRNGRYRHGMSDNPTHISWQSIRQRINNPSNKDYDAYRSRGIKLCSRWDSFENFYADMGDRPEGMCIDRIDNNGDYTPENCRWATQTQQQQNRSITRLNPVAVKVIRHFYDLGRGIQEIATLHGLPYPTVRDAAIRNTWKNVPELDIR